MKKYEFVEGDTIIHEGRTLTAYRAKSGVVLTRGCFLGSIDQFVEAVQEDHGLTLIGKEYLAMAGIIKLRFNL